MDQNSGIVASAVCRGQDGEPLQLLMRGVNLYTGGHFDEYDTTFFDYKARPFPWSW